MSKLTRETLLQFGSTGPTGDFGKFGSQAASAPVTTKSISTIQSLTAWLNGFQDAVAAGQAPYLQDMNSVLYVLAYEQCYTLQEGTPEYDSGTTYYIGSLVKRTGTSEIYMSLTDTNVGNALPTAGTSSANWQFVYGIIGGVFKVGATLTLTDNLVFSPTTKGIKGTTTNDNTAAGNVGEYVETIFSSINSGATGAWADMGSISLTAGDWELSLNVQNDTTSGTTTSVVVGIGLVSGNVDPSNGDGNNRAKIAGTLPTTVSLCVPGYRQSLGGTTTIYAKHFRTYTGGAPSAGRISARRLR